jgi:Ca2+-binding RTX toxin-like protein
MGDGGNDMLMGGLSIDTSSGGTVSDSFVLSRSPNVVSNLDILTDFLPSIDRPEFDSSIFSGLSWDELGSLSPNVFVPDAGLTTALLGTTTYTTLIAYEVGGVVI